MTEDEARTKWCPMVRLAGGVDWTGSSNSDAQTPYNKSPLHCCIASDCMMWRIEYDMQTLEPIGGYCGLADRNR